MDQPYCINVHRCPPYSRLEIPVRRSRPSGEGQLEKGRYSCCCSYLWYSQSSCYSYISICSSQRHSFPPNHDSELGYSSFGLLRPTDLQEQNMTIPFSDLTFKGTSIYLFANLIVRRTYFHCSLSAQHRLSTMP